MTGLVENRWSGVCNIDFTCVIQLYYLNTKAKFSMSL